MLWAKQADHILNGVVIADSSGSQPLFLMVVVLQSEMEIAARMPFVKEYPYIMLYCLLDFIQFKLQLDVWSHRIEMSVT